MKLDIIRKSKILVTGGAGFIGSSLCEFFVRNCIKVRCLDNFSTGTHKNINNLLSSEYFELINGDINDILTCQNACVGMDYVIHQAALGSVTRSIEDPIKTNDSNVNGFLNMLVASRDNKIKRFVYAASSSTYGDSQILPKVEDKIGNPMSPYAITKLVNELYAKNFSLIYGIETIGLRYFNVFGKRQTPEGAYAAVIPKFIKKLINLESPIINGDGYHSRDFTYIKNVVEANLLSLLTKNKNSLNRVYNIAYGSSTSLNELFIMLKQLLSNYNPEIMKIEPIHGNERIGDVKHSLASIEKAKKLLNYNPKYDIRKGMVESIDWYWHNLNK